MSGLVPFSVAKVGLSIVGSPYISFPFSQEHPWYHFTFACISRAAGWLDLCGYWCRSRHQTNTRQPGLTSKVSAVFPIWPDGSLALEQKGSDTNVTVLHPFSVHRYSVLTSGWSCSRPLGFLSWGLRNISLCVKICVIKGWVNLSVFKERISCGLTLIVHMTEIHYSVAQVFGAWLLILLWLFIMH